MSLRLANFMRRVDACVERLAEAVSAAKPMRIILWQADGIPIAPPYEKELPPRGEYLGIHVIAIPHGKFLPSPWPEPEPIDLTQGFRLPDLRPTSYFLVDALPEPPLDSIMRTPPIYVAVDNTKSTDIPPVTIHRHTLDPEPDEQRIADEIAEFEVELAKLRKSTKAPIPLGQRPPDWNMPR